MQSFYSKYSDIEAVMQKAERSLVGIEEKYTESLKEKQINDELLVEVKDYLSNLRSALDYLWHKIPKVKGEYFPIANSEADFLNKVIGIDAAISNALFRYQDFDQRSWIRCFSLFRNKNVHVTLIPQTKKETREFSVRSPSGSATFRDCIFNTSIGSVAFGNIPLVIDMQSQFPVDTPGLDIERIIWVDFIFDGSAISPSFPVGISALPFLRESFEQVKEILKDIEVFL